MVENTTSVPVKQSAAGEAPASPARWPGIGHLRSEIDRLFDDFNGFDWRFPFTRRSLPRLLQGQTSWSFVPAMDLAENAEAFSLTAELPGMEGKDIEVKLSNGSLVIKGEKEAASETKQDDYYVSERQYGSFCRTVALPDGVDRDRIEAAFSNGVLTVTLPKSAEALKSEKTIAIKAA